jgi:hypothetical protein
MLSRPLLAPFDGLEPSRPTSWALVSLGSGNPLRYERLARRAGCESFRIDVRLACLSRSAGCRPSLEAMRFFST